MSLYMLQFSYTPEAWAALTRNPEDRSVQVKTNIEKLGGRLLGMYYSFGEFDGMAIVELPDSVATMAYVLAAIGTGMLKATRSTQLFSISEAMQAMAKAGAVKLAPPKG